MSKKKFNLKQISNFLDGDLNGKEDLTVSGVSSLNLANKDDISFIYSKKFVEQLKVTQAKAVVLEKEFSDFCSVDSIVVGNAHLAYAKLTQLFKKELKKSGITPSAFIETKKIDLSSYIGPNVIIEKGAKIGKGVKVNGGVFIGNDAEIGDGSVIHPNVTIYSETKVGKNCIIHANSVLGSDGLGFANNNEKWEKIEHLGIVLIKDKVEIGAGCTIDRSSIGETTINSGVKLDNQVHIAHNCEIGENTIIGAKTAIAGTTKVGKRCKIGGGCGIIDNIQISDDVTVTPMSFVTKSISKKGIYSGGSMLMEHKNWLKYSAKLKRDSKSEH